MDQPRYFTDEQLDARWEAHEAKVEEQLELKCFVRASWVKKYYASIMEWKGGDE